MFENYGDNENVGVSNENGLASELKSLKKERDEEMADIESTTNQDLNNLNQEILNEDLVKYVYKNLNLGYSPEDFSPMREKMTNRFDKNSLEGILFNNTQIQNFFNSTISEQGKNWERVNKEHKAKSNKESEDENIIEDWRDYSLRESSPENFEQFLLSDEGVNLLKREINDHIDSNGNIYANYPISKKVLQLKLRKAWFNSMRREYNEKNGIITDNDKINVKRYGNLIVDGIDNIVGEYLKGGGDKSGNGLLNKLESLINDEDSGIILDMKEDSVDMDNFKESLRESIKKYSNIILNRKTGDRINLSTGETQLDLQLKLYLFTYGKISYPNDFKGNGELINYEENLKELLEAILIYDGKLVELRNNNYLERIREDERKRQERDLQRRKQASEINRKKNEHIRPFPKIDNEIGANRIRKESTNLNDATGVEIATNANLGKKLNNYNLELEESENKNQWIKEAGFNTAWVEFIQSHDDMKDFITKEQMRGIFDFENNSIDHPKWENFVKYSPVFKLKPQGEIDKIYNTLNSFSHTLNEVSSILYNNSSERKIKVSETVKNYAVGSIIDNVRNIFEEIGNRQGDNIKGFELNDKESPVTLENESSISGDNLVISGFFNGSDIKIRYNLKTGELFTNSILQRQSPNKITIGNNSLIDHPIGRIEPFDKVLNDNYKFPPLPTRNSLIGTPLQHNIEKSFNGGSNIQNMRGMGPNSMKTKIKIEEEIQSKRETAQNLLNSKIDLIKDTVINDVQKQAAKNGSILGFMKTFNIIKKSDDGNFNKVDINEGSNLFNFIQIIEKTYKDESNGTQALEYFNNKFMPFIMKCSGLKRGENNINQDKRNNDSKKVFNNENANKNTKYLKSKVEDFNPNPFSGETDLKSGHQLKFVDLIEEKLLDDVTHSKLDIGKMEMFIEQMENDGNDIEENPNKILANNLEEI